jgi:hypothetical protein
MAQPMSDSSPVDSQQAEFIARVRRLMLLTVGGTFLAVAVVVMLIGYRLFRSGESAVKHATATAPVAPVAATLPAGAKVLSSAVGDGHIVLTVEVDGAIELRSFDLKTLKPLGRLRLAPKQ